MTAQLQQRPCDPGFVRLQGFMICISSCTAVDGGAVGLLAVTNALLNGSTFTNNTASTGAAQCFV